MRLDSTNEHGTYTEQYRLACDICNVPSQKRLFRGTR
jgi:hypothetical protein